FAWYNQEHRHCGLGLLSPAVVHHGLAPAAIERRRKVLDTAYRAHPERFVRLILIQTRADTKRFANAKSETRLESKALFTPQWAGSA
ncbi:MAG: hypothetical protein ACLQU2_05710, partial [Candidatus Binataceae bacterium]